MASNDTTISHDVTEADFEARVIERSREVPVVVDFWAEWCAPCRQLGPVIEQAVAERAGKVELVKVDTDGNPGLATRYGIQGIPAVKAFRDGEVALEFTGALPAAQVEAFLDSLVPSEADELAERALAEGDEESLRRVLELEPQHGAAAAALARILLQRGDPDAALELLEPLAPTDFVVAGLAARARLARSGEVPLAALEAWDAGDHEPALGALLDEISATKDPERRDLLRAVMVGIFTELGSDDPLAMEYRRKLASLLN